MEFKKTENKLTKYTTRYHDHNIEITIEHNGMTVWVYCSVDGNFTDVIFTTNETKNDDKILKTVEDWIDTEDYRESYLDSYFYDLAKLQSCYEPDEWIDDWAYLEDLDDECD